MYLSTKPVTMHPPYLYNEIEEVQERDKMNERLVKGMTTKFKV